MSPIKVNSKGLPIMRVSERKDRTREICVGLEPLSICFRLKGTRRMYRLPIGLAYEKACELQANLERPARKKHLVKRNLMM